MHLRVGCIIVVGVEVVEDEWVKTAGQRELARL